MPYFQIITFGCKVNQCDSAGLAHGLWARGWQAPPAGVAPDLVLVNTCTVTARADQQARQAVRRLGRNYPKVPLVVTGCYAQRAPAEVAALAGVQAVWGNREKIRLAGLLAATGTKAGPRLEVGPISAAEPLHSWPLHPLPGHTRVWLRVQDGCSHHCQYCIVPQVRGPSRSLEPPAVADRFQEAAQLGYQEVVLTGVDLGQYGRDLTPAADLAGLVRRFKERPWPFRVRFSSLEPQEITAALLKECASWREFCPHFHLPLQSAAAPVLAALGRPYSPQDFRDLAWEIKRLFPDAALGLDILAGFPTETASDFEATRLLVASLPVAYLHVFPFSSRPGTAAAQMPPLPSKEVRGRARLMRELGRLKKLKFLESQLGKVREVLVEGPLPQKGCLKGLSDNYLKVVFPGLPQWRNCRLKVRLLRLSGELLVGEAVN
jgi:threonylcarbamoyladenosine tRNA methylthiotransferase MtaB